jgi:hypothetical protein
MPGQSGTATVMPYYDIGAQIESTAMVLAICRL